VASNDERSAEAREIAERALGRLLAASAPAGEALIVLGGLVPPTLARTDAPGVPAHLGMTSIKQPSSQKFEEYERLPKND
jgi:hypothetical protein